MLVPLESSSALLLVISSKSVSICNRFHAIVDIDSSRYRTFCKLYPNLKLPYGGLVQRRKSKLRPLKSTFNAENFIRRLSSSISSDFGAIHY